MKTGEPFSLNYSNAVKLSGYNTHWLRKKDVPFMRRGMTRYYRRSDILKAIADNDKPNHRPRPPEFSDKEIAASMMGEDEEFIDPAEVMAHIGAAEQI